MNTKREAAKRAAESALQDVSGVLQADAAIAKAAASPIDGEETRALMEQRVADWKAITDGQRNLKAARRALHQANLKRTRLAKRVETALRAFEEGCAAADAAQAALKIAQADNDRAFADAAKHSLAAGFKCEPVGQPPRLRR